MKVYIVTGFPSMSGRSPKYSLGVVLALNESAAKAHVIQMLKYQGLDVTPLTALDIQLSEWNTGKPGLQIFMG